MIKNTQNSYGSVAKWLHWLTAFWILAAYFSIVYYWRFINPSPELPASMPAWQVTASHVSHFLLYFFLITMPLSGYIGNSHGVDYVLFKVTPFKDPGIGIWIMSLFNVTYEQFEVGFDAFHYRVVGPYIFWVVIAVHAFAGLYHHYIEKDDVLKRMLPEKQ